MHKSDIRKMLVKAPHFQGGHSDAGREIAKQLNCGFPVRMHGLIKAAKREGMDPKELWPWMRTFKHIAP